MPGHGRMELGGTLPLGGPSLMVETIEQLTGDRINDYSAIDFAALPSVIGALGGVTVDVPYAVISDGFTFPAGSTASPRRTRSRTRASRGSARSAASNSRRTCSGRSWTRSAASTCSAGR